MIDRALSCFYGTGMALALSLAGAAQSGCFFTPEMHFYQLQRTLRQGNHYGALVSVMKGRLDCKRADGRAIGIDWRGLWLTSVFKVRIGPCGACAHHVVWACTWSHSSLPNLCVIQMTCALSMIAS